MKIATLTIEPDGIGYDEKLFSNRIEARHAIAANLGTGDGNIQFGDYYQSWGKICFDAYEVIYSDIRG